MRMVPLLLVLLLQSTAWAFTPDDLWQAWPVERFVRTPAPCLRPAELNAELQKLSELYPEKIQLEEVGRSFEGRPITLITLGHGPDTVLLWSQMHGDEPSATPALLDIAAFLLVHSEEPAAAAILDHLTLVMIPMLNPDGAQDYRRRNAQGIDINRDARILATPEGRILKRIRDEYEPVLGFNLHDQDRRKTVGNTGVPATIAVLAVTGDEARTLSPGRLRAKRACAAIVEALTPLIPGGLARFDESWSPRSFGDNLTAWGTPVVLIESGGLPPGRDLEELTRLNFVAILTVLQELTRNDLVSHGFEVYDTLPLNERNIWADVVMRGGFMLRPGVDSPYRADLAFNVAVDDRDAAGCATGNASRSRVVEVGDAAFLGAGRVVDAGESLLLTPLVVGIEGWSARRWLNSTALLDVARLGVGTVIWEVPHQKIEAAESLAHELAGAGQARLEVVQAPTALPWLTLTGPPDQPASFSLADIVNALEGKGKSRQSLTPETVDLLLRSSLLSSTQSPLRFGGPASFLLLHPAPKGRIDPQTTRLRAVYINGAEVLGGSP